MSKRKISDEEMAKYDEYLGEVSKKLLTYPMSVVKAFADYLVNAVNVTCYLADLDAQGLEFKIVKKDESEGTK